MKLNQGCPSNSFQERHCSRFDSPTRVIGNPDKATIRPWRYR